MNTELVIPAFGESINEVTLGSWLIKDGEHVKEGDILSEIESEKATVDFPAPTSGIIKILAKQGDTLKIGDKIGEITNEEIKPIAPIIAKAVEKVEPIIPTVSPSRATHSEPMSMLRKTIATKLVKARNTTATLTTFNEVDMTALMELRKKHKEDLGITAFFSKVTAMALREFPIINAQIDNNDNIVFHDYVDLGIAVATPKGLVVPVIRDVDRISIGQIEKEIKRLATKAREGKISIDEMSGGTFSITNGGIYGSMLSTPLLNIPQSAILGMHNIVDRAVVKEGKIIICPIMYLALSYDHRLIDGHDAVSFLKKVKDTLEDPTLLLLD